MRTTLFCGSFTTRPRTESGASAPLLQRSTQLFQKEYEIPFRRSRRCKTVHLRIAPTAATNFGEEGLSTNQGSLLGPPPPSSNGSRLQSRGNGPVTTDIEEVKLESDVGYDWQPLKTFLKEKDFQKADDETRAALIQLAGEEAQSQRYVYWTQVKFIPKKDLQTIDALWRAASGNKFGTASRRRSSVRAGSSGPVLPADWAGSTASATTTRSGLRSSRTAWTHQRGISRLPTRCGARSCSWSCYSIPRSRVPRRQHPRPMLPRRSPLGDPASSSPSKPFQQQR
eukprot:jgi/Botrbrau1/6744/Bobra.0324s0029.1